MTHYNCDSAQCILVIEDNHQPLFLPLLDRRKEGLFEISHRTLN